MSLTSVSLFRSVAALALAAACIVPQVASAATAYLRASTALVSAGDTVVLEVWLEPGDAELNVVEGQLKVEAEPGLVELRDLNVGGSSLSLWPRSPSWDAASQTISFTGGVPGGLPAGEAQLFRIALLAKRAGTVTVSPASITAYANDGRGTAVPVSGQSLTVAVGEASGSVRDAWRDLVAADNEAPRFISVELGRDPAAYDGQWFLAIEAVDGQSGLDRFEVAEGSWPAVRTGSVYVLRDQSLSSRPVTVFAYDVAGNVATYTYGTPAAEAGQPLGRSTLAIVLGGLAAVTLLVGWAMWRRRRR